MTDAATIFERLCRVTGLQDRNRARNRKRANIFNLVTAVTAVTADFGHTGAKHDLTARIVAAGGIATWEPRGHPAKVVKIARFEQGAPPAELLEDLRAAGWLVLIWPTPEERLQADAARALDPALAGDPAEVTLRGEVEG